MSHVLDLVAKEAGGNLGPGRPGVVAGTASLAHVQRRELFGQLGIPLGQESEHLMNEGKQAPVPSVTVYEEKPAHTIMVMLRSRGFTFDEIAGETGYTPQHVRTVCAQPWARKKIQLVQKDGLSDAKLFLGQAMMDQLQTVKDLADDPKNPPGVRLAAANSLLDRYLGKPSTSTADVKPAVEADSVEELDSQLAGLKALEDDILRRAPKRDPKCIVIEVSETKSAPHVLANV